MEPPWAENVTRAKKPQRLPVVLTKTEVIDILSALKDGGMSTARLSRKAIN
ncbi:hypothetical protein SAMN05421831_110117 [Allopseudospirillum japonicum]|uniref:Uncharacterized protein n=1 Tax=Allopseudospirillum japonicum TaxID=64971 RepID=A0A1H6TUL8_9GAMM|nr:hypothetical protein SAMN05421831_110117 [Allopseudospirillum japonicum]